MGHKFLLLTVLTFCFSISTRCTVVKHDNGKHKGWFKNPNNPHNPLHASKGNPGKGNHGKGKK